MGGYILRRLLLIIPTLLGIMIVNFALVQFVPGGPIEQIIAEIEGQGDVFGGIAGGVDAPQFDEAPRRAAETTDMPARAACRRSSSRSWNANSASTSRRWNAFWTCFGITCGSISGKAISVPSR